MTTRKRIFKKYSAAEREKLGLDKVPDTMYDPHGVKREFYHTEAENLPIRYDDIEDEEELEIE